MSSAADRPSHAGIMTEDISNVTETSCNTMILCTVRNSCTITDYMRGHLRQRETLLDPWCWCEYRGYSYYNEREQSTLITQARLAHSYILQVK